ncbi:MAG: pyruvate kinase [Clostridia bacterium]|nr:pyruvate kinase [Clostridia bacterium]
MRKTKIVCTLGPACESAEVLEAMCKAGMNVARLNFSHGTHEQHLKKIELVKKVREKLDLPIAILLDTKGPEYRIKTFENGKINLSEGDTFTFTTEDIEGNQEKVSVTYKGLCEEMSIGDKILLNNGLLIFEVTEICAPEVKCKVLAGGELSDRKSMAFPGKVLKQKYLSEQDKSDIKFGIENDVDFVACSFVSTAQDLRDVQNYIDSVNPNSRITLIAKIENQSGVDNIEEICEECEGIMIGRGDMGVEIPFEELPAIQKKLITKCRLLGKRVITATEMLESMIYNPRPTRAEISDVANAVYDGTSAIMLSGETAAGKYPVQTVETMARIAEHTEKNIHYNKRFKNNDFKIKNIVDALSHSACAMAMDIDAKCIVVCSLSGMTSRMVSRFRPPMEIIGFTADEKTRRKLALSWGVIPMRAEFFKSTDVLFYSAVNAAKKQLNLQPGDKVLITGGNTSGVSGTTDMIKIEIVD